MVKAKVADISLWSNTAITKSNRYSQAGMPKMKLDQARQKSSSQQTLVIFMHIYAHVPQCGCVYTVQMHLHTFSVYR